MCIVSLSFLMTRPDLTAAEEELMVVEDRLKRAVSSLYINTTIADNKEELERKLSSC